jgi:TetR/AcrR family transcriptional regulator, transcriptional repressor of bet genes
VTRRPFRRAAEDERRADLVRATLDCIAEDGLQNASLRRIALRAGVTNGLIRHYFAGKEQMIHAAYRATMSGMTDMAKAAIADLDGSPRERLRGFVRANLTPPVLDRRTLSIWAAFVSVIRSDPDMAAIHRAGYLDFRREVEGLVRDLLEDEGREASAPVCERLAIQINAVVDGLWLEGCLAGEMFDGDDLALIGIEAVDRLVSTAPSLHST